jgi:hypothetical protein
MQLPSRRAYHVIYDNSLLDALQYASEHDWTGIVPDFNVPHFSPEKFSTKEKEKLREVSTQLKIEWGFHAPADDISLYITYPPIKKAIIEYMKQIIDFIREISWKKTNLVIHAGTPPSFKQAGDRTDTFDEIHNEVYSDALVSTIHDLIDYALPDVTIAIENHEWTSLTRKLVKKLIREGLKLCLDIVKLYNSNNQALKDDDWMIFIENSKAIEVIHIHDWINELGSHQIVGNGRIDFVPALKLLSELEHPAQYVFEVRPRSAAQQSLHRFSGLLKELNINLI